MTQPLQEISTCFFTLTTTTIRNLIRYSTDRLLNNPYVEPPTSKDWEVHPTYRVRNVPYYLAPLWDAGLKRQSTKRHDANVAEKNATRTVANKPTTPGVVPKELREKLKRSRGAKGLLMDLEGEVRKFVSEWETSAREAEAEGLPTDPGDRICWTKWADP